MSPPLLPAEVDVTRWLPSERDAFVELLATLDDSAWAAPTECPAWDVRGIALHVLGDDLSLLARQRDAAPNGLITFASTHPGLGFRELLDGFNEQWVTAAAFMGPKLIIELLRITGEWTNTFYTSVDSASMGEPVGFFNERHASPYWQIVGREFVERWVHHHQIRRALSLPPLDTVFLGPAIDVVARGVAASMPALGAEPGQGITFDVTGVGTWTLERGDDRWSLARSVSASRFLLEPDNAALLFSRGLAGSDVPAALGSSRDAITSAVAAWLAQVVGRS